MITLSDINQARTCLNGITTRTRLIELNHADSSRRLFLKPENQQPIGAFKLRGAYNKIASLSDDDKNAASSLTPAATTPKGSPMLPVSSK